MQAFGIDIDKNVVHRVLAKHYRPAPGGTGPSWLSFLGHTADSLWSVPFVERLIGTMRREFLDHELFWNARDLERKLAEFQVYYNAARCHASLDGRTPPTFADNRPVADADPSQVRGSPTAVTSSSSQSPPDGRNSRPTAGTKASGQFWQSARGRIFEHHDSADL